MRKCLPLNLLKPTKAKRKLLKETYSTFFRIVIKALGSVGDVRSRAQLHRETYEKFRGKYGVASQLIIEATRYAWSIRKTINGEIEKCVFRFDRRLFSFKKTKRGNPILSLRTNLKRIGLPISQDGASQRLQEHVEEDWKVTSIIMKRDLSFSAVLSKDFLKPTIKPNWMDVDINSSKIAVSINQ